MKTLLFLVVISVQSLLAQDICFSPAGHCDQKLIGLINSSKKTLDVAIYSIDHAGIASAIIEAKNRGVAVRMIVDRGQSKKTQSQVSTLVKSKVPLKIGNVKGIMHNKYSILDGQMLETGSFNYKNNSSNDNAENQIYISDLSVIKIYQENFDKLWTNGLEK